MRIAVIGGGIAGLTAAWLLGVEHQVVLYEAADSLGGNARSVLVGHPSSEIWATPGATFILPGAYPYTIALLRHFAVPLRRNPVGLTIVDESRSVRWATPRLRRPTGVAERGDASGWLRFLAEAWKLERSGDWTLTWNRFVDALGVGDPFLHEIANPIVAAFWGLRPSEIGPLSARALLAYVSRPMPGAKRWVPGWPVECTHGTGRLVEAITAGLGAIDIRLHAEVRSVVASGSSLVVKQAEVGEKFDRVIMAVPPWNAHCLLGDPTLRDLGRLQRTPALIAVHCDEAMLPEDPALHSPAVVVVGEGRSQLTTIVGSCGASTVLRSWITSGGGPRSGVLSTTSFSHVAPTIDLFRMQERVRAWQGTRHCWLAGSWTWDVDSIESAVRSALSSAGGIDPSASRVRWLRGRARV